MFDVKILESRAKSIYKLKNIKLLKRNITGLREVEILKKHWDFSQEKKQTERKKLSCSVSGVRSDSKVREHRSLWYKIPSIDFCDRSSFTDASVAKSF